MINVYSDRARCRFACKQGTIRRKAKWQINAQIFFFELKVYVSDFHAVMCSEHLIGVTSYWLTGVVVAWYN
jgi:hypothetical protein